MSTERIDSCQLANNWITKVKKKVDRPKVWVFTTKVPFSNLLAPLLKGYYVVSRYRCQKQEERSVDDEVSASHASNPRKTQHSQNIGSLYNVIDILLKLGLCMLGRVARANAGRDRETEGLR
jgi:hypothetical protein